MGQENSHFSVTDFVAETAEWERVTAFCQNTLLEYHNFQGFSNTEPSVYGFSGTFKALKKDFQNARTFNHSQELYKSQGRSCPCMR